MNQTPVILPPTPKSRPKSKSGIFLFYGFMFMVVALTVFMVIYGTLNYKGFCFKQMRYLSDEEKLKIVIVKIGYIKHSTTLCYRVVGEYVKSINRNYRECIAPYASIEEFMQANPGLLQVAQAWRQFS